MQRGVDYIGTTVRFFCHDGNGKLFLARRSKNTRDEHGRWDPGGGGLKHGESVEESMRREVKEEYGVTPLDTQFIGYFDAFRETPEGLPNHWLAMCFAVKVDPDEVTINEPEMVDDSGWFTLDNLRIRGHDVDVHWKDGHYIVRVDHTRTPSQLVAIGQQGQQRRSDASLRPGPRWPGPRRGHGQHRWSRRR